MSRILIVASVALMAQPATAQKRARADSAQVQRLLGCRAEADPTKRLACFDRETSSIETAIARKDLVFVDRERATAARKDLFGFSVPSFGGLFGGGDEDDIKQIESTVVATSRNADGGWIITLADKSVWSQTDDTPLGLSPKRGNKVVVRRATLGAFRLSVNGQPGLKVKRVG